MSISVPLSVIGPLLPLYVAPSFIVVIVIAAFVVGFWLGALAHAWTHDD